MIEYFRNRFPWRRRSTERKETPPKDPIKELVPIYTEEDLQNLELQLESSPVKDHLAVFIRDPKNPNIYWYRKMKVGKVSLKSEGGNEYEYTAVTVFDLGQFNTKPCSQVKLKAALQTLKLLEEKISQDEDEEIRATQAVVGVARYNGKKSYTIDDLTNLTAYKYLELRTAAFN